MRRLLPPPFLPQFLPRLLLVGLLLPLLLTAAPQSHLAHDAGYYALQARWIEQSDQWLAPLWFGQPLFDRCIGAQWLMALGLRLSGGAAWAETAPALLAAFTSVLLCGWLAQQLLPGSAAERRRLGWLSAAVLALTPLWLNYAHLATQDMLLLAVELAGLAALVAWRPGAGEHWALLAGLTPGLAFLIKGFMVALPLLAIAPYLLLERRRLLRQWILWLGLGLGWLPVLLWLSASVHSYGLPVVSGLWTKLLFLSSSDSFAPGPLYYLWNIPANTAPWILAALGGWPLLWRAPLERGHRLLLLLYPLLLLLLLSAFRTKTPYYGLQLSPFIAMAAAVGLRSWSQVPGGWLRRFDGLIASIGVVLLLGVGLLLWPTGTLRGALAAAEGLPSWVALAAAAAGLGLSWLAVPWQATPQRRLAAVLLGPWLALVVLHQGGLFSDRTPALRRALALPAAQAELRQGPIEAAAGQPLSGDDHALLISLALATPQTPSQLLHPSAVGEGQTVWIRRTEMGDPQTWRVAVEEPALQGWLLAQRRHNTPSPIR